MNAQQIHHLIENLYQAVDKKDLGFLADNLSKDVKFRIGNNPTINGLENTLAGNKGFFASIESMRHRIRSVMIHKDSAACDGTVDYVRLDGSAFSAYFSTFISIQDGQITDYYVYADLSDL